MKNAIVTGATGGIGAAIVKKLVMLQFRVYCPVRDLAKGAALKREIAQQTGINDMVDVVKCDLSIRSDIIKFCEDYKTSERPLHLLVNNAAIVPQERQETPDGIEMQWAVNVLSYFYLIEGLESVLLASAPSRVVNLGSIYAGGLKLTDPEFKTREYDGNEAYRQSKQANRLMSAYYADKYRDKSIICTSCHPGVIDTSLLRSLGFSAMHTADEGAETPVYCATADGIETGKFYNHCAVANCKYSSDLKTAAKLHDLFMEYASRK